MKRWIRKRNKASDPTGKKFRQGGPLWKKLFLVLLAVVPLVFFGAENVSADVATDYISVRIGYQGWDLDEYVETGSYFWGDLEGMAYDSFYSYFSGQETTLKEKDGGGTAFYEYNAIVDYAFGVDLKQLLEYAHVYFGDVYNVLFWVEDHSTIWCSFDRDALFYNRYYFPDISGNRTVYYDEGERPYAYSFNDMGDQVEVAPMMALEDAWISFTENSAHSVVDIDTAFGMRSPARRFRLLFGQTSITSSETREAAQYVSTIYVTYWGQPSFGEMPELDGTLGSHSVDMQVYTESDMRYALSELMKLSSTDETVLQITGMEILPDEYFTDKTTVRIYYDIVGEGVAGINAGIGRNMEMAQATQTVDTDDFIDTGGNEQGDDPGDGSEGEPGDDPGGSPSDDGQEEESGGGSEGSDETGSDEEKGDGGKDPDDDPSDDGEDSAEPAPEASKEDEPGSASEDPGEKDLTPDPEKDGPDEPEETKEERPGPDEELPKESITEPPDTEPETIKETPDLLDQLNEEETVRTAEFSENNNSIIKMRKLSNNAAAGLDDALEKRNARRQESEMVIYTPQLADRDIEQLSIEDNTEEKEREKKFILLCTAAAGAGFAAAGAFSSILNYRICLKREKVFPKKNRFSKWLRGE